MKILVTGGAGYIGGFAARRLAALGHEVVVVDDLRAGHRAAAADLELVETDCGNSLEMQNVIRAHGTEAVMHFAASTGEGQSNKAPAKYYANNVANTLSLLNAACACGVDRFVFSSSAAMYAADEREALTEAARILPRSCYARTKRTVEFMLEDYRRAYGLGYAALRYFNAAGAAPDGSHGESHDPETHLIPIVLQVPLGQRGDIVLMGNDFDTPDGTTVRDYVHVEDVASAHVLALEALAPGGAMTYNIGTGTGSSVLDVIRAAEAVSGTSIPTTIGPKRADESPYRVAGSVRIRNELGWTPQYSDLTLIVKTAWAWHSAHPHGWRGDGAA